MKTSSLLGIASAVARGKKYRLLLTGLQFAVLGYTYYRNKKNRATNRSSKRVKK